MRLFDRKNSRINQSNFQGSTFFFFGNVANNFYRLCKALNRNRDEPFPSILFLSENEGKTNVPEGEENSLTIDDPSWINRHKTNRLRYLTFANRKHPIRNLPDQGVIFLSSTNVISTKLIDYALSVFYATGADITIFPFAKRHIKAIMDDKSIDACQKLFRIIRAVPYSLLLKSAIKKVDFVVANNFEPYRNSIEKLGIPARKVISSCPLISIDTSLFVESFPKEDDLKPEIVESFNRFDFKILSGSRLLTDPRSFYKTTGQYKGNEVLLDVLIRLTIRFPFQRIGVFFIDRSPFDRGETAKMKDRIRHLNLTSNVVWLKPHASDSFTRREMIYLYSLSDVVFNDVGSGWFGSLTLEAMSCSRPVINYVNESVMRKMYGEHPMISSILPEDISDCLENLVLYEERRKQLGRLSRNWVEQFHSEQAIVNQFKNVVSQINVIGGKH
jgi:glycosyltransferase involved in cell wall biosynthesis